MSESVKINENVKLTIFAIRTNKVVVKLKT